MINVIGSGGMGIVFKARNLNPPTRWVAIKVMQPHLAADDDLRRRFKVEANALANIDTKDHVVEIHDVHEKSGVPYIVMEYVNGESLRDWIERVHPKSTRRGAWRPFAKRPPREVVLRIGLDVARGLVAIHKAKLVHRDIKPSNILRLLSDGRCKIVDFGLVKDLDQDATVTYPVPGTMGWKSPEQAAG